MSFFKKTALFSIALSAFLLPACGGNDSNDDGDNNGKVDTEHSDLVQSVKSLTASRKDSSATDSEIKSFVLNQYDLNFNLFRAVSDQIKQDNAMISTLSLQMAFAMLWAGAQSNTHSDIKKALNFDGSTHEVLNALDARLMSLNKEAVHNEYEDIDATEINLTNNLYLSPNHNWANAWLDELATNYGAGIEAADFAAHPEDVRKYINAVVSKDTHERIKDLLPEGSITPTTQAVITNAIYFKAPWPAPLHKLTDKITFTKLDKSSVDADFLSTSGHYPYIATENYQAVSLPLRNNDFRVLFVIPEADQFDNVAQSLSASDIDSIFNDSKTDAVIDLKLPSFTFETSLSLKSPLKNLGMITPFSEDADFSKMTSDPNDFYIDQVFQKTFVGLDDKGVEAAAATAISVGGNSGMPVQEQHIELNLDHPYYFVIYETKTKTPLFFGRLMDPTAK